LTIEDFDLHFDEHFESHLLRNGLYCAPPVCDPKVIGVWITPSGFTSLPTQEEEYSFLGFIPTNKQKQQTNQGNMLSKCGSALGLGPSGLPCYCTPLVCVPAIGTLAVWWQNTKKIKSVNPSSYPLFCFPCTQSQICLEKLQCCLTSARISKTPSLYI